MSRDNIVPVRLDDNEKEALQVMAYREGFTVSGFLRAMIYREAKTWNIEIHSVDDGTNSEGVEK